MAHNPIGAVLFDMDGVLIDADALHFEALNKALGEQGFNISYEEHIHFYKGLPTRLKLKIMSIKNGLKANLHTVINDKKQKYTQELSKEKIFPNKRHLKIFHYLKAHNYQIAVCSNSIRKTIELMISQAGLLNYVDLIISNQDVDKPKPSPEIFLKAALALNLEKHNCFIVEDSPVGIQAAINSGCHFMTVSKPDDLNLACLMNSIENIGKMRILIPTAGRGTRFQKAGYTFPKPLIEIKNKPMIQLVVENIGNTGHYVFVAQKEHVDKFSLKSLLQTLHPKCDVFTVDHVTEGAACTALLASNAINNNEELLIANSDQLVDYDLQKFLNAMRSHDADGGILTFKATHPKWSYAKTDLSNKRVVEVAEKRVISEFATVGIYYFKKGYEFVKYITQMIEKNIRTNNEFYICPVYNEYIRGGKKIFIHNIDGNLMHGLGTPEDLHHYLEKH